MPSVFGAFRILVGKRVTDMPSGGVRMALDDRDMFSHIVLSLIGQSSCVELSRLTSLQVPNQAIRTEDCTCRVAFQDRWRSAIAP